MDSPIVTTALLIISTVLWYACDLYKNRAAEDKIAYEKYNLDRGYANGLKFIVIKRLAQTTTALFVVSVINDIVQTFLI